jgi:hypothetical protein
MHQSSFAKTHRVSRRGKGRLARRRGALEVARRWLFDKTHMVNATKKDGFSNLDFLSPYLPYYKQTFSIVFTVQSTCGSWEKSGASPALSRNCQNVRSLHSRWSRTATCSQIARCHSLAKDLRV